MFCISALPARASRIATSSRLGSALATPPSFPAARFLSTEASTALPTKPTFASTITRSSQKNRPLQRTAAPQSWFTASSHQPQPRSICNTTSCRHASTTTPFSALSRSYSTAASSSATPLTWNRFLALRKTRRRISLGSSVICGSIVLGVGLSSIMASDFDSTAAATFGIDPIAVLGLSSAGLIAVGWLLGPAFGNTLFGFAYRGHKGAIEAKEREFFTRIKKHRVDPANSSIANPVPDYYGEKIGSVADYRRWLKDQRAYNLKRGKNV